MRATVDEHNRVWSAVVVRNGAPIGDLERVMAGAWLAEVRGKVQAMRAAGQYRTPRQLAPITILSASYISATRIEALVRENWDDKLFASDGRVVSDLSGPFDQRYVLQQINGRWYVVESKIFT